MDSLSEFHGETVHDICTYFKKFDVHFCGVSLNQSKLLISRAVTFRLINLALRLLQVMLQDFPRVTALISPVGLMMGLHISPELIGDFPRSSINTRDFKAWDARVELSKKIPAS